MRQATGRRLTIPFSAFPPVPLAASFFVTKVLSVHFPIYFQTLFAEIDSGQGFMYGRAYHMPRRRQRKFQQIADNKRVYYKTGSGDLNLREEQEKYSLFFPIFSFLGWRYLSYSETRSGSLLECAGKEEGEEDARGWTGSGFPLEPGPTGRGWMAEMPNTGSFPPRRGRTPGTKGPTRPGP